MAYTTIDKPKDHFNIITWTGDGDTASNKTGVGFQPDWTWIKKRTDDVEDHAAFDSSRGLGGKLLNPNATAVQETAGNNGYISNFIADGFSIASNGSDAYKWAYLNESGDTFVAWNWKANGGTTTSVSATGTAHESTMAGTHQANTTAGFSIVTFNTASEDAGDKLITHGLGKIPEWIIVKSLSSGDWYCHHISANDNDSKYIRINVNNSFSNSGSRNTFDTSNITTTQFAVDHNNIVNDNESHVAYVFAPIQGYSKFGSYKGNGNADGPYVYTGFKPAYVWHKDTGSTEQWQIKDTTRFPANPNYYPIQSNSTAVEGNNTNSKMDFLSNGFKVKNNDGSHNTDGSTYVYIAFAENPLVTSGGVPATAR